MKVDEHPGNGPEAMVTDQVLADIRKVPNILNVWRVRLET